MQRSSRYAMSSLRHCRRFLRFDLACGRVMETMQPLMNTIWRSLSVRFAGRYSIEDLQSLRKFTALSKSFFMFLRLTVDSGARIPCFPVDFPRLKKILIVPTSFNFVNKVWRGNSICRFGPVDGPMRSCPHSNSLLCGRFQRFVCLLGNVCP